jgi:hypothetical protein
MFKSKSIFLNPFEKESHIYPCNNVVDWYDYVRNRMHGGSIKMGMIYCWHLFIFLLILNRML